MSFATGLPLVTIIASSFNLADMEDFSYTAIYIFLTFGCMFVLNYLVARDLKILFLLEKETVIYNNELESTLNLFDGAVLIIDNGSHEILFKNN